MLSRNAHFAVHANHALRAYNASLDVRELHAHHAEHVPHALHSENVMHAVHTLRAWHAVHARAKCQVKRLRVSNESR